jgi:hypothetical protein
VSRSGAGAYEAALAPHGDGFAVAWHDQRDGNAEIYLRLLDGAGQPSGPERRLTHTAAASYEPSLDTLGDGLAVAWYERAGSGALTARLGLWNADGTSLWAHDLPAPSRNPVVRARGDAVFCAWVQTTEDGTESVWAGWWDARGQPSRDPVQIAPASTTTWNLNAAIDAGGVAWVVFDADASTRASELFLARVTADDARVRLVSADDGAPSKYPDLAISPDGRAALTWFDERDGNQEVYLMTAPSADALGDVEEHARRVTASPGASTGAYAAWNGDRLGLAWSDELHGQPEIFHQPFDGAGSPLEPAHRVTRNPTWSLVPAIRPFRGGFALASFQTVP